MGVADTISGGILVQEKNRNDVGKFLNRVLGLKVLYQNWVCTRMCTLCRFLGLAGRAAFWLLFCLFGCYNRYSKERGKVQESL